MTPQRKKPCGQEILAYRRRSRADLLRSTALQAATLAVLTTPAIAQLAPTAHPTGGQVVGGQAQIGGNGNTTLITQTSQNTAINWQSYNVGSAETVQYVQPNARSLALNTVVGADPSQIAGHILANGQIILVNQSGVVFSKGSQVDTAGLVVSSAGISTQNFMAGHMVFDQAGKAGATISNAGNITIRQAGLAALVAPQVSNSGTITAQLGRVILGGAVTHTLDLYGDGLVALNVTGQVTQASLGGKTVPALVTNTGTILAPGGTVVLTAAAVDGVVTNLVTAGGVIAAPSVGAQTGRVLVQGVGGGITIDGNVSATGMASGTLGGQVVANATGAVNVAAGAVVDASGDAGGGLVALGTTAARAAGGPSVHATLTASTTSIAKGARVSANAVTHGKGGRVTVLSQSSTWQSGAIETSGGKAGGNGGFIEVSSTGVVHLDGTERAGAAHGALGTILIDPADILVTDAPGNAGPLVTVISSQTFHDFTGAVILSADGTITIASSITLGVGGQSLELSGDLGVDIDASINAGNKSVLLVSNGNGQTAGSITENSSGSITAGILAAQSNGAIQLDSAANMFSDIGQFSNKGQTPDGLVVEEENGMVEVRLPTVADEETVLGITAGGDVVLNDSSLSALTIENSITGTAVTIVSTNGLNQTIGTIKASSGALVLTAENGSLTFGGTLLAGTSSPNDYNGVVTLTAAGGSITEEAGGVLLAGTLTGSATAASFAQASNRLSTLDAFSTTGGSFSLDDAASLVVGGMVVAGGDISLAITGVVGHTPNNLQVGAAGAGALSGADVTLTASGGILLDSTVSATGKLELIAAGGDITENGPGGLLIGKILAASATGSILLGNANSIADIGAVGSVVGLTAGSSKGDILLNDTVALTVADTLSAPSGKIVLSDGGNTGELAIDASITGTAVTLSSMGGLTQSIESTIEASSGLLALNADGTIEFAGTLQAGTVDLSSSAGNIEEDSSGVLLAGVLQSASAGYTYLGAVSNSFRGNQIAELSNASASGNFVLVDGENLTVAGELSVTGGVDAGGVSIHAPTLTVPGSIDVTGTGLVSLVANQFDIHGTVTDKDGIVALDLLNSGNFTVPGTIDTDSLANISAGTLALGSIDGVHLNDPANFTDGAWGASSAGSIFELIFDAAFDAATSVGPTGALGLFSNGSILNTEGTTSNPITAGVLYGAAGTATLLGANQIGTLGTFTTSFAFTLEDSIDLLVNGMVLAKNGAVDITETGGLLTLSNNITGTDVTLVSDGAVVQTAYALKASATAGTLIIAADGGSLTLKGTDETLANGVTLLFAADGDIDASAATLQTGTLAAAAAAGSIILTGFNTVAFIGSFSPNLASLPATLAGLTASGDVSLLDLGSLTLNDATVQAPGDISLIATGELVQNGGLISSSGSGNVLVSSTGGDVTQKAGVITSETQDVVITAAGNIGFAGEINGGSGVFLDAATGDITETVPEQTTTGYIVAPTLAAGAGGNILLGSAGNQIATIGSMTAGNVTLAGITAGGATGILLVDSQSLSIADGTIVDATGGAVMVSVLGGTNPTLSIGTNAGASIDALDNIDLIVDGTISQGGGVISSTAGNILVVSNAGDVVQTHGAIDATQGSVTVMAADSVLQDGGTISAGTDVSVTAGNSVRQENNSLIDAAANALVVASTGDIAQNSSTISAKGSVAVSAGGSLAQTTGIILSGTTVTLTAGTSVSQYDSLIAAGTNATVQASTGDITQAGSSVTAAGALDLIAGNGITQTSGIFKGGSVTMVARKAGIAFAGLVQGVTNVLLSAAGSISESANGSPATGRIIAPTLAADAGGSLALDNASSNPTQANQIGSIAALAAGTLSLAGLTAGGGTLTLTDMEDLTIADNAAITAPGGSIQLAVGSTFPGAIFALTIGTGSGATIQAEGNVTLSASGVLAQTAGLIQSDQADVAINGLSVTETGGTIAAPSGSVAVDAGQAGFLQQAGGLITASATIDIDSALTASFVASTVSAGQDLTIVSGLGGMGEVAQGEGLAGDVLHAGNNLSISVFGGGELIQTEGNTISAGTAMTLTAAGDISLAGTVQTGTLSLVSTGAAISAPGGSIIAGILAASAAGAIDLTNTSNRIGAIASVGSLTGLSATNDIILTDGESLIVDGSVISAGGSIALAAQGAMTIDGELAASRILLGNYPDAGVQTGTVAFNSGASIDTASSLAGQTDAIDVPAPLTTGNGLFINAANVTQTGVLTINDGSTDGGRATLQITVDGTGAVSFAKLVAPTTQLILVLEKGGSASGSIDVAGLNLFYTQGIVPVVPTALEGTVGDYSGTAAAGAGFAHEVDPPENLASVDYQINACPIESLNCVLLSPLIVPVGPPVDDYFVDSLRKRDTDDDALPNVAEEDY